jgi:hypothetical protein
MTFATKTLDIAIVIGTAVIERDDVVWFLRCLDYVFCKAMPAQWLCSQPTPTLHDSAAPSETITDAHEISLL